MSSNCAHAHGVSVIYGYDDLNRLSTVTDANLAGAPTDITQYGYVAASNVATVTYPNGVQSTFTYDTLNRVTGLSSPPASYTYQRGPTGNLLSTTESSGRQVNWSYDGIYRLTNETIALAPSGHNGGVAYGLDPVGNRDSVVSSLGGVPSGTFSFNPDDELSSETYDANGNVLTTGGKSFSYNSQNQMTSMTSGSTAVAMIYDGFGNRVAKTVNGVTTQYLVEDDKNPTGYPQVFDELTNGVVTRTYTYGLQRIDEEQQTANVWTPSYYGYDGGGNVRNLTNSTGAVTDQYEYDAFGNSFTVSGTTPNNYLYRGEQYDSDLALYYLRARYYNPATGRFMSRDPGPGDSDDDADLTDDDGNDLTDPASLHKYLYAGGDPANEVDPSGQDALVEDSQLTKLIAITLITTATYVQMTHQMAPGQLQALGIEINCMFNTDASKLSAALGWALAGGNGEIIRVGDCTWTFFASHKKKRPSTKNKHQEGQGRKAASRGPGTHPKYPPRKRPDGWKGPWTPGKTGWGEGDD